MISWRWYCSLFKRPDEAKRQRWERIKARGRRNFIFRVGLLQWGGFMFVVMTAQDLIRKPPFPRQMIDYLFEILINLLIWPVAGYFFGLVMWRFYETYFGGQTQRDQATPPTFT